MTKTQGINLQVYPLVLPTAALPSRADSIFLHILTHIARALILRMASLAKGKMLALQYLSGADPVEFLTLLTPLPFFAFLFADLSDMPAMLLR